MQYKMIKNIWHNYTTTEEYEAFQRKYVPHKYQFSEELNQKLKNDLSSKTYVDLDCVVSDFVCTAEANGFIQGFKMATQLISECFSG